MFCPFLIVIAAVLALQLALTRCTKTEYGFQHKALEAGAIKFIHSVPADFGPEQVKECRKPRDFQALSTHSGEKSVVPEGVEPQYPEETNCHPKR